MRKPRTTILLLTAIVAAFGFNSYLQRSKTAKWTPISPGFAETDVSQTDSSLRGKIVREGEQFESRVTRVPPAVITNTSKAVSLSDEANTLVSEMCTLHLLADKANLSLSPREWSAFASVVLQIQAIRETYEAQIATSQTLAPGRYRLEIPAYASVGDALREKFRAELRLELGEAKAGDVLTKLGGQLEGQFAGFGMSMQTLEITANSGGTLSDLEVTRTVTYWNSVEGSDALTTRREVHFPAFEDPAGESWNALLAVVKA